MEQILPALEGQLRQFRRHAAALADGHPGLARHLSATGTMPDAHVDRLVQGVAMLHARSALALQRARRRQDEHMLELHFPQQLRPFPACRFEPGDSAGVTIVAARYCRDGAIELEFALARPCPAGSMLAIQIDGDAAFSAALRSALLGRGTGMRGALASCRPAGGDWRSLRHWPVRPAGLEAEEALLPRPAGAHAGLALLREFFVFPARFNAVCLELAHFSGAAHWTLRLPVAAAGLLEALRAGHLRAGWRARANLLRAAATPVLVDGYRDEYLLSLPPEMELFSIDRVRAVCGEAVREVPPLACATADAGWIARRVGAPVGHEWRIALRGEALLGAVLSVDVTCCRRAEVLARAVRGTGCRWQLNSLLALDRLPLNAAALREIMASQALGATAASQSIIGALQALEVVPAMLCVNGAAPLAGSEVRLKVDEAALAGCGLLLYAQVLERYFGECAHLNTFTRLVLLAAGTGKELMRCKARNAATVLE